MIYGEIIDNEILDNVIVSVFRSPLSYTGDSVEISCHASPYISKESLVLIENGAAACREFTQGRLNGKLDLSQAEAVADLIASSHIGPQVAMNQMKGVTNEIANIRKQLLHFASMLELELDFGEEDVEFADERNSLYLLRIYYRPPKN